MYGKLGLHSLEKITWSMVHGIILAYLVPLHISLCWINLLNMLNVAEVLGWHMSKQSGCVATRTTSRPSKLSWAQVQWLLPHSRPSPMIMRKILRKHRSHKEHCTFMEKNVLMAGQCNHDMQSLTVHCSLSLNILHQIRQVSLPANLHLQTTKWSNPRAPGQLNSIQAK